MIFSSYFTVFIEVAVNISVAITASREYLLPLGI